MTNLERLQKVADALEELNARIVYVGGSLTGLYTKDPAAPECRVTMDVDCIVDYKSYADKEAFEKSLRQKHFCESQEQNSVICRWIYDGEIIDVMPTDARYYGFTNRWYKEGIQNNEEFRLPNGRIVQILPVVTFVATKLEALKSRGCDDLRGEKDFEDIVYILNGCPDFHIYLQKCSNEELKSFVVNEMGMILSRPNLTEEIECALPLGEEGRSEEVIEAISQCVKV